MAVNEIEMNKFSEGSTGTGGRVDELTFPVDISHGSRSQQAHANEKDLDLELNLEKENVGGGPSGGPSGGSSEDDERVHPVSESRSETEVEGQRRVTFLEPIREEDEFEDDGDRTHQQVGDPQNTDHTVVTVTVEESDPDRICRTCGPDEEITEPDNLLVKLGCNCRGSLSRMHRKCILEWYGPRICQENNYKCELCNALLHGRIECIVFNALIGQAPGGDILFKALGMAPSPRHPRSNAIVEAPIQIQAHDGNAHLDFHEINIVEITHGLAQQPYHSIWDLARNQQQDTNRPYNGYTRGGYPMCVVVFIILVLIGFAVAGVDKLH